MSSISSCISFKKNHIINPSPVIGVYSVIFTCTARRSQQFSRQLAGDLRYTHLAVIKCGLRNCLIQDRILQSRTSCRVGYPVGYPIESGSCIRVGYPIEQVILCGRVSYRVWYPKELCILRSRVSYRVGHLKGQGIIRLCLTDGRQFVVATGYNKRFSY